MTSASKSFSLTDILYESFYTAGIGGSFVALSFLLIDGLYGRPFFTPSLLGQVLFFHTPAASVGSASIKAVAYYTPVHFFAFFLVGLVGSFLIRTMEAHTRRPFWVMLVLFGIMEGSYLLVTRYFLPGVGDVLDSPRVAGVNFFAAICMVAFLHYTQRMESDTRAGSAQPLSSQAG